MLIRVFCFLIWDQMGAVGVPAGIRSSGSPFGLIASPFEVISQRCWAGGVGGRLVCVCEPIHLRCVCVFGCVLGVAGGVLGEGADFLVFGLE